MTLDEELKVYVKVATTKEDLGHCARIRYTVFGEGGYLDKKDYPAGREIDGFDLLKTTIDLLAFYEGEPAATVRILDYNQEIVEKNKGWIFGFEMEKIFDLAPYKKEGMYVAEMPRSSCLSKYRDVGGKNNVMINLWGAGIQIGIIKGITHFTGIANIETDSTKEAKMIYEMCKRKGHILPEYNVKARKKHSNPNPKHLLYEPSLIDKVNFNDLSNEDLSKFELPTIVKLFTWMGIKYTGNPIFYPSFGRYAFPLLWDINNLPEKSRERFLSKIDLRF